MDNRYIDMVQSFIDDRDRLGFSKIFKKGEVRILEEFLPEYPEVSEILKKHDYILDHKTLNVYKTKDTDKKNPTKLGRASNKIIQSLDKKIEQSKSLYGIKKMEVPTEDPFWKLIGCTTVIGLREYDKQLQVANALKEYFPTFPRNFTDMMMTTPYNLYDTVIWMVDDDYSWEGIDGNDENVTHTAKNSMLPEEFETLKGIAEDFKNIQKFQEEVLSIRVDINILKNQALNTQKHWAIFSRAPVDVLRMSDFKNIQSCHSEGGSYFYCAVEEAKGNGIVVFIVSDTEKQKIKDLQDDEIFKDPDRGIDGIVPTSRIRMRRIKRLEDEEDFALPEPTIYGKSVNGLAEFILDWARKKQPKFYKNKKANPKDFGRVGGTYANKNFGSMLSTFLDVDDFGYYDSMEYIGDEEELENPEDAYNELMEYCDNEYYNRCFNMIEVEYTVERGEDPYVSMSGSTVLDIDTSLINSEWLGGNLKDLYSWSGGQYVDGGWASSRERWGEEKVEKNELYMSIVREVVSQFEAYDGFSAYGDTITVNFNGDGYSFDDFSSFLDNMENNEGAYDTIQRKLIMKLTEANFLITPEHLVEIKNAINNIANDLDHITFDHAFDLGVDEYDGDDGLDNVVASMEVILSNNPIVSVLKPMNGQTFDYLHDHPISKFQDNMGNFLDDMVTFKNVKDTEFYNNNPFFDTEEFHEYNRPSLDKLRSKFYFSCYGGNNILGQSDYVKVIIKWKMNTSDSDEVEDTIYMLRTLKYIDDHYDEIELGLRQLWDLDVTSKLLKSKPLPDLSKFTFKRYDQEPAGADTLSAYEIYDEDGNSLGLSFNVYRPREVTGDDPRIWTDGVIYRHIQDIKRSWY